MQQESEVIRVLRSFSDEKYQLAAWFSKTSFISPTEMANWPDDVHMQEWFNKNPNRFEYDASSYIKKFFAELDAIPDHVDSFDAFVSLEWVRIRLMATVLLRMLGENGGPGTVDTSGLFRDNLKNSG